MASPRKDITHHYDYDTYYLRLKKIKVNNALMKGKGRKALKYLTPQSFKEECFNTLTIDGKTLLHQAAFHDSNIQVVSEILNSPYFIERHSVDSIDINGFTALHIAAICGCTQIAMLLLDHGANRFKPAPEMNNQNAIELAGIFRHFDLSDQIKLKIPSPLPLSEDILLQEEPSSWTTRMTNSVSSLISAQFFSPSGNLSNTRQAAGENEWLSDDEYKQTMRLGNGHQKRE